MKQAMIGFGVGLICSVLFAVSPFGQNEDTPCDGWRVDCLAMEAALLMSVNGDYDKYQNIRDNIGVVMSRMLGGGKFIWENEKLLKSKRIENDKIREAIIEEAVKFALEMKNSNRIIVPEDGRTDLETRNISMVVDLDN